MLLGQLGDRPRCCTSSIDYAAASGIRLKAPRSTAMTHSSRILHLQRKLTPTHKLFRCFDNSQGCRRSFATRVQAASTAQQQFPGNLSGTGAGGALPSKYISDAPFVELMKSKLCSIYARKLINWQSVKHSQIPAGFVNWVNTCKPPKYLWRTLAALLMGGQALVRILQGRQLKLWHLYCFAEAAATVSR